MLAKGSEADKREEEMRREMGIVSLILSTPVTSDSC
jgi:hypothetical protein